MDLPHAEMPTKTFAPPCASATAVFSAAVFDAENPAVVANTGADNLDDDDAAQRANEAGLFHRRMNYLHSNLLSVRFGLDSREALDSLIDLLHDPDQPDDVRAVIREFFNS